MHSRPPHYAAVDIEWTNNCLEDIYSRGFNNDAIKSMLPFLPSGTYIAGGSVAAAILGQDIASDIDMFFDSGHTFERMYNLLQVPPSHEDAWALRGYTTDVSLQDVRDDNTIRFVKFTHKDPTRLPIQLIKLVWFENKSSVINSFDFTVTQFAMDNNGLTYDPLALIDLLKKTIVIHKSQYPVTTLRRLIKYSNKGFHVSPLTLLQVAEDIKNAVEVQDPNLSGYDK
jgi:hypothetical protein